MNNVRCPKCGENHQVVLRRTFTKVCTVGGGIAGALGTVGGAKAGAAFGATICSVVPVFGTTAGAAAGAFLGALGGVLTGAKAGHTIGKKIDKLFGVYYCYNCNHEFEAEIEEQYHITLGVFLREKNNYRVYLVGTIGSAIHIVTVLIIQKCFSPF